MRRLGLPLLASLVVLVVGQIATLLAVGSVVEASEHNQDVAAGRYSMEARAAVDAEMHRYLDTVEAVAASLSAQEDLRAGDYATVTKPLLDARLAGASGIGFAVPATDAQTAGVQRYWRSQGERDLKVMPDPKTVIHRFVVLWRNLDGQNDALGYDLGPSAELNWTLERASRTDEVAVSDAYVLLKDRALPEAEQQRSFAIAAPVTAPRPDGSAGADRGWVVLGVRGGDLLQGTLRDTTQGQANVTLTAARADGTPVVVAGEMHGPAHDADLRRTTELPVGEHTWTITTQSTDATARRDGGGHGGLVLLLAGSGLTILMALVTWLVMSSRGRAMSAVERATADLRASRREAAEQAALLKTVMDSLSDGVGAVDRDGRFILHNPAAAELLGVDEDVDDPDRWTEYYGLYQPDGLTPFPTAQLPLVRALEGHSTSQVEMIVRPSGSPYGRPISVSARPLLSAGETLGAVAVFHDLSTVKEFQRQLAERAILLQARNLDLQEANRELEAFSYTVSHDLRAPLRAMTAFSKLVLRDHAGAVDEQALHYLTRIHENALSMNALIEDLLAFSRTLRAPLNKRPTSIGDVVRSAWEQIGEASPFPAEDPEPELLLGDLPVVPADSSLLKQVFVNLLSNAVKFRVPGRGVRVTVECAEVEGEPWITVRDNGIGFDPAQTDKIFGVFQRLHRAEDYEGTGIGLSIVHRIVTRHGGRIEAGATLGEGAFFTFSLGPDTALEPVPVGQ